MTRSRVRRDGTKSTLILAGTSRRAGQIADARGIPRAEVAFPRTLDDAQRWFTLGLPMIVDWSLPSHPQAVMLDEFATAYMWRHAPRSWRRGARRDQ